MKYDNWKTRLSDDDIEIAICCHEYFDIDYPQARATCTDCGWEWLLTEEELEAHRKADAWYADYCRREERRQWWREVRSSLWKNTIGRVWTAQ